MEKYKFIFPICKRILSDGYMLKIEKIQKIEIAEGISILATLRYNTSLGESRYISDPAPIRNNEKIKIDIFLGEQQIDFIFFEIEQTPDASKILTSALLDGLRRYITNETAIKQWESVHSAIEELRNR
jgi:hypothetical protein